MWDLRRGDLIGRAYRRTVPTKLRHHIKYMQRNGRPAYLPWSHPRTFTGKVVWRVQNDRRDLLKPLCDKLAVKDLAAEVGVPTPVTLWAGTDPDALAEASQSFSGRWVLKPNHDSQVVHFYEGPISPDEAHRVAGGWPSSNPGRTYGEWAYLHARKLIIAEESLTPAGVDLPDYRMFTFDGRPVVCALDRGKFDRRSMGVYRLPGWEWMDVRYGTLPQASAVPVPAQSPLLLDAAQKLGAGYDFVRVDLYATRGQVWLGEITPYPTIGLTSLRPRSFDEWLGSHWTLPLMDRR